MLGMSFGGLTEAVLLVALGLGYIVCYLANREEKTLRTVGYCIGTFMMVLSALLITISVFFSARICNNMPYHRMMMKGQMPLAPPQMPQK